MAESNINPVRKLVIAAIKALREDDFSQTIKLCEEILDLRENHAGAHSMLFTSLYNAGDLEHARQIGGKAAELNPSSEFILNNQACLQLDAKHPAAAATLLRSLIKQYGPKAKWLYNLGLAQRSVGSYRNAIDVFRQTLEVNPSHERAAYQLADSYQQCGKLELATKQFNYLRLLRPHHRETRRWYIFHAAQNGDISDQELKQEIRLWGTRFIPQGKNYPSNRNRKSKVRKIGFVIGDIPEHWWDTMVNPVISQLALKEDVYVYWQSKRREPSQLGPKISISTTLNLSDSDFARQVRKDEIDTIVDVCGMRAGCRQRVLGLKLANKQFGWLAHEGHYISDKIKVIDYLFGPQKFAMTALPPSVEPHSSQSELTLFCLNCGEGISKKTVSIWIRLLRQLPTWKMVFEVERAEIVKEITKNFLSFGIAEDRFSFSAVLRPHNSSLCLENLNRNDVVTVARAINAGATVIALEGNSFLTKQSSKLLRQLGKDEWIGEDSISYIEKIVTIANSVESEPVSKEAMVASGLFDIESFARRFRRLVR